MNANRKSFAAKSAVLATALGLAFSAQAAGNLSGQLNAQMVLQAGCIISGAPNAGTSGLKV